MKLKEIIWATKQILDSDGTLLNRSFPERDIAVRAGYHRQALIVAKLEKEGMTALNPLWMQPIVGRKTRMSSSYSSAFDLMVCFLELGSNPMYSQEVPIVSLYGAAMDDSADAVKRQFFTSYARKAAAMYGGRVCSCFWATELVISPPIDQVYGSVLLADPLAALMDSNGTTRAFDAELDDYPVDGELAAAIVMAICQEAGVKRELKPSDVRFNPSDERNP